MNIIKEVWRAISADPKVYAGLLWAVAKLDGSFYFLVRSNASRVLLESCLPPGIVYVAEANYSDAEIERMAKYKIEKR